MKLMEDSLVPLYQQVMDDIRQGIEDGRYGVGQKIPSESELSEIYSVSRITIRRAIEELSTEGYLTKKQGKGTYVNHPKLKKKLKQCGPLESFTDLCQKAGRVAGARVTQRQREAATADVALALGITEGDEVIRLRRVRTVDDKPCLIETSFFPANEYSFMENETLDNASIYNVLACHECRQPIKMRDALIEMARANVETAAELEICVGEPLFSEVGTFADEDGRAVFLGKLIIVATDYCFLF